ncbi:helix-turn-helix domain-containing protein [Paenibacillus andongensis]|uniref:helix-turn-helix domain-containing protein n=1 Tax=Paenibacillus andongensis TaxID=2975482 RepID=UPI0021BAD179|nr:helix-turn-helix domain-containing protein [Paenibacillus andongensis]
MYSVLIIDDEELIGDGVKAKLERAGLSAVGKIHVAYGGLQGLQAAKELKPHIIITDMRMPEVDGIELIRQLTQQLPLTKFIMLSGHDDYSYVREAFKYGVLDYLLKPASSAELAGQVQAAIAAIEADNRQALVLERNQQDEQTLLTARLNVLLNAAAERADRLPQPASLMTTAHDLPDPLESWHMLDSFFVHPSFAVGLFSMGAAAFSTRDLAHADACLNQSIRLTECTTQLQILAFHDTQGKVYAVFNLAETLPLDAFDALLRETVAQLSLDSSDKPVVSVSKIGGLKDLPQLYRQAQLAMSYRILREPDTVLYLNEPPKRQEEWLPARKDIDELRQSVETLQLERIHLWIDRWLPDSLVERISLEQLEAVFDLLMTEIHRHFNGRLIFEENKQAQAFASFHTLHDLRQYLKGYVYTAKQLVSESTSLEGAVIGDAMSYVRQHFYREIQLAEVANRVSMNYSYFSKLFKERIGLTFTAYLTKIRMEEAQKLLKDPALRIHEISEKVGYSNPYHFSRAFKNHCGISPKEFRNTMQ